MLRTLAAFTLLVVLSGCSKPDPIIRMYGDWRYNDGYETVEAHREQIADLVDDYAADAQRNRLAAEQLGLAARTDARLAPFATQAADLSELQNVLLIEQREHADLLIEGGSYRELNRGYGAMVTEQQILADRYYDLGRQIEAMSDTSAAGQIESTVVRSRYQIVPPHWLRRDYEARQPSLRVTADPGQAIQDAPAETIEPEFVGEAEVDAESDDQ